MHFSLRVFHHSLLNLGDNYCKPSIKERKCPLGEILVIFLLVACKETDYRIQFICRVWWVDGPLCHWYLDQWKATGSKMMGLPADREEVSSCCCA